MRSSHAAWAENGNERARADMVHCTGLCCPVPAMGPEWVLCHEHRRSTRRCATVLEMKEGPSGSAIRSSIPSHRERLWSKATVVSVAETSDDDPGRHDRERRAQANCFGSVESGLGDVRTGG
jgi:hypothetical protein